MLCVFLVGSSDILGYDCTSLGSCPCIGYTYSHVWRGNFDQTKVRIICAVGCYSVYVTYT